jgi:hypothetical protein
MWQRAILPGGKGFTFSADGFDLYYSEVPPDAP